MGDTTSKPDPITKVSIVISKGSLEGVYPGLIMANGARAEGMEANLFFTFFGLDASTRLATSTSSWPRWATPVSTSRRWPVVCPACRP